MSMTRYLSKYSLPIPIKVTRWLPTVVLLLAGVPGAALGVEPMDTVLRAHVMPIQYTTLSAEMDGRIQRLSLREGEAFKKGASLVSFICGEEKALRNRSRAVLNFAKKTLAVSHRLDELGTTSTMVLEQAKSEVGTTKAELQAAEARVRRCSIVAPFSGRVAELHARNHQYVQRGEPLMRIVDPSKLEVEMIVPSRWLTWLKMGHRFALELDEADGQHAAEITAIGAWIDPVSQSVKLHAKILGNDARLLPGMSGRAFLNRDQNES